MALTPKEALEQAMNDKLADSAVINFKTACIAAATAHAQATLSEISEHTIPEGLPKNQTFWEMVFKDAGLQVINLNANKLFLNIQL